MIKVKRLGFSYKYIRKQKNYINVELFDQLKLRIKTIDIPNIKNTYDDLYNLADLTVTLQSKSNVAVSLKYLNKKRIKKNIKISDNYSKTITLLKAVYVFADIFTNVFLNEVYNKKFIKWPLSRFCNLAKSRPNLTLPEDVTRKIWLIKHYRNKIIIHWEFPKTNSSMGNVDGTIRHTPLPKNMHFENKDLQDIKSLYCKYRTTTNTTKIHSNLYEQLWEIYNEIPILNRTKLNPDREKIDGIAGKGGIQSMQAKEILDSINKFIYALTKSVMKCNGRFKTPK